MYKIQNISQGSIPLDLEVGSMILCSGQFFDLDGVCSREWIKTNPFVNGLVAEGYIRVIHDSQEGVPGYPVGPVVPVVLPFVPVPAELASPMTPSPVVVRIIDLSTNTQIPPRPPVAVSSPVVEPPRAVPEYKTAAEVIKSIEEKELPKVETPKIEPKKEMPKVAEKSKEEVKVSTTSYGSKKYKKKH